jgi:AcrR family transcriptional regulator
MTSTTTLNTGPWERKRTRSSLEIERAGLQLIAQRGLDQVTVEQVAAAGGISVRTFYRYFRNVPELLTGVPRREIARICDLVSERPREEDLLDAFRAGFDAVESKLTDRENADLKEETLGLWSLIAAEDPDRVSSESHALTQMTVGFTQVIQERLDLDPSDEVTAGVLGAALAGVVWFVYLGFIESGGSGSLPTKMDEAFEHLAALFQTEGVVNRNGPHSRTR